MSSDFNSSWVVTLIDPEDGSGDAILPIPDDILSSLGWAEGDELSITLEEKKVILRKIS